MLFSENPFVHSLYEDESPVSSFEFFPPKDGAGITHLCQTVEALKPLRPSFVSVTYGAGGSTQKQTSRVASLLRNEYGLSVVPHLTCVGASKDSLCDHLDKTYEAGYRNIMALRGDPPKGQNIFTQHKNGLRYGSDLVALIKNRYPDLGIGIGAYPEKHPEASSSDKDIEHLKIKVDAGASFIITQLFFDNAVYFRFVERCRKKGITIPIIPGIMPVLSLEQILRFSKACGATIPIQLLNQLESVTGDTIATEEIGAIWAGEQIAELIKYGAPGYHLYTLNRAKSALIIAKILKNSQAAQALAI
ncbi:MAG: methylenetetrahydrofolate reductase [NAD(P)H] [Opitutaceae bacterium]|nr:methylenetetrahydrofolate reductase [NAD(P)H] [Opitutaceae bacterium]